MIAEAQTTPETLFHFLVTDVRVVGIVGWTGTVIGVVSLIVTVAGFWIAIVQLKRVKQSAEAAQLAVRQMTGIVHGREQSARLSHASSQLRSAMAHLTSNPGAAGVYMDSSRTSLVEARVLAGRTEDQDAIATYLSQIRRIGDNLKPYRPDPLPSSKLKSYEADIQTIVSELEASVARLRYNFDQIGLPL